MRLPHPVASLCGSLTAFSCSSVSSVPSGISLSIYFSLFQLLTASSAHLALFLPPRDPRVNHRILPSSAARPRATSSAEAASRACAVAGAPAAPACGGRGPALRILRLQPRGSVNREPVWAQTPERFRLSLRILSQQGDHTAKPLLRSGPWGCALGSDSPLSIRKSECGSRHECV